MDDAEEPLKPPSKYRDHRGPTRVVKRPPEEMKAHLLRVLSEAFGKVNSLDEASEIARFNIQLTGGGTDE